MGRHHHRVISRLLPRAAVLGLAAVPVAFIAIFFLLPLLGMLGRGFVTESGTVDLSGIPEVLGRARTGRVVVFTVSIAAAGTALTVLLGLPVAYVLYRLEFVGAAVARAVIVMPFVMPTVVVGVMFRSLLSPSGPAGFLGWDGHWVSILLAFVFFNLAVVVRIVGSTWSGMDRRSEDAAAALGAPPWRVWRTITLPALTPAIISASTLVFLFCSTAFGVVLTLGGLRYGTIETEIYFLTTQFFDLRAAAVLSILQVIFVLVLLQVAASARAGAEQSLRPRSGLSRRPVRRDAAPIALTMVIVAFVLLPVLTLVWGSVRDRGSWTLRFYTLLGEPSASRGRRVSVVEAIGNSVTTALDATALAVILGVVVSFVVTRSSRRPSERRLLHGVDALFMLPLGVSAVTIGFGFLITLDRPPLDLRSSPVLVPIAQAMVALPLVVRTLTPALGGVDPRLRQAAAALGAGPFRAAWTVDVAVLARPILAATGFAFAVSLGEFGATSFLVRPDRPTVPVLIYDLLGSPGPDNAGMALAASVVLAVMTTIAIASVERLRPPAHGSL